VAATDEKVALAVQEMISVENFSVYVTTNIIGVETKNQATPKNMFHLNK